MTPKPDAMTVATPLTNAKRARVSASSSSTMKRSVASSLPLFHNPWNPAAIPFAAAAGYSAPSGAAGSEAGTGARAQAGGGSKTRRRAQTGG